MTRTELAERVIDAARPIAAAAADLLASTRDQSEIWEMPAAMSITAGDLRRLESAIAAYDAAPADDGWMPIETAPKDGTKILVACAGEDISDSPMELTEWFESWDCHFEPIEGEPGKYIRVNRLYYSGWNGNGHRATHWHPLPPPPGSPKPKR